MTERVKYTVYRANLQDVRKQISASLHDVDNRLIELETGGSALPPGGDEGQVLAKASDSDFDFEWVDQTGGGGGTDGKGWTSGFYTPSTGIVTFTSDDGLGFTTTDLRGADGKDGKDGEDGQKGDKGDQGDPGPTAVSTDPDNDASLGGDGLIYVPQGPYRWTTASLKYITPREYNTFLARDFGRQVIQGGKGRGAVVADTYEELLSVIPAGNARNYTITGQILGQTGANTLLYQFKLTIRSDDVDTGNIKKLLRYAPYNFENESGRESTFLGWDYDLATPVLLFNSTTSELRLALRSTIPMQQISVTFDLRQRGGYDDTRYLDTRVAVADLPAEWEEIEGNKTPFMVDYRNRTVAVDGMAGGGNRNVKVDDDGTLVPGPLVEPSTDADNIVSVGSDGLIYVPAGGGEPGKDGKGWTGGSYNSGNGVVTFTSDDGLGFATGDLRGEDGEKGDPGPTAVSSDAGNTATLGNDGLIFVPSSGGGGASPFIGYGTIYSQIRSQSQTAINNGISVYNYGNNSDYSIRFDAVQMDANGNASAVDNSTLLDGFRNLYEFYQPLIVLTWIKDGLSYRTVYRIKSVAAAGSEGIRFECSRLNGPISPANLSYCTLEIDPQRGGVDSGAFTPSATGVTMKSDSRIIWTRVGRLFTFDGKLSWSSRTNNTTILDVKGFPFPSVNGFNSIVGEWSADANVNAVQYLEPQNSFTHGVRFMSATKSVRFVAMYGKNSVGTGATPGQISNLLLNSLTSSGDFEFSGTLQVASIST